MQMETNQLYRIEIRGHLDARWQDWFEGLTLTQTADGNTVISGGIADQAALHGVLKKLNSLGLTLISVHLQERKNL